MGYKINGDKQTDVLLLHTYLDPDRPLQGLTLVLPYVTRDLDCLPLSETTYWEIFVVSGDRDPLNRVR